jgi:hypothetical protein
MFYTQEFFRLLQVSTYSSVTVGELIPGLILLFVAICIVYSVPSYIIFTIAKGENIEKPYRAWIPLINLDLLKQEAGNRIVCLLSIIGQAMGVAGLMLFVYVLINLIRNL